MVSHGNGRRDKRRRQQRRRTPRAETDFWKTQEAGREYRAYVCRWKDANYFLLIKYNRVENRYDLELRGGRGRAERWYGRTGTYMEGVLVATTALPRGPKRLEVDRAAQKWAFYNLPRTDLEILALAAEADIEDARDNPKRPISLRIGYGMHRLMRLGAREGTVVADVADRRDASVDWVTVSVTGDEAYAVYRFAEMVVDEGGPFPSKAPQRFPPEDQVRAAQSFLQSIDPLLVMSWSAKDNPQKKRWSVEQEEELLAALGLPSHEECRALVEEETGRRVKPAGKRVAKRSGEVGRYLPDEGKGAGWLITPAGHGQVKIEYRSFSYGIMGSGWIPLSQVDPAVFGLLLLAQLGKKNPRGKKHYDWMNLDDVLPFVPLMQAEGVSAVARSPRGFLTAYRRAGGDPYRMGTDSYSGQDWISRRNGFVARHWAQIQARNEPLWEGGQPTRRHLALIAWAFTPDPDGVEDWLGK